MELITLQVVTVIIYVKLVYLIKMEFSPGNKDRRWENFYGTEF